MKDKPRNIEIINVFLIMELAMVGPKKWGGGGGDTPDPSHTIFDFLLKSCLSQWTLVYENVKRVFSLNPHFVRFPKP